MRHQRPLPFENVTKHTSWGFSGICPNLGNFFRMSVYGLIIFHYKAPGGPLFPFRIELSFSARYVVM